MSGMDSARARAAASRLAQRQQEDIYRIVEEYLRRIDPRLASGTIPLSGTGGLSGVLQPVNGGTGVVSGFNAILTDADGNVLVDANGNVLTGA